MGNYKTWNGLRRKLEQKVEKALDTEVRLAVEEEIGKRITIDVYKAYEPIEYSRSYSLYNIDNFVGYTSGNFKYSSHGDVGNKSFPDMYLSVGHHAVTPDMKDLTKLIILGQDRARFYGEGIALYNDLYIRKRKVRYKNEGNPNNDTTPFYEPRNFMGNAKMIIQSDRSIVLNAFERGMK